jgi:ABC-2 type transport system permease protein
MLAISRASLRSIFRSPSAVVFSFAFPLIFIIIFGFVGNSGFKLDVGISHGSDTSSILYQKISSHPSFNLVREESDSEMIHDLNKGRIDGILDIRPNPPGEGSYYTITIKTSASSRNTSLLISTLQSLIDKGTLSMLLQEHPMNTKGRRDKGGQAAWPALQVD